MNRTWGTIAMLISATGMGLVPLFSRWGTRTDMFDGTAGLNAGDSVGALMAVGRMTMGFIFFVVLLFATHKVGVFKKLKVTPAIILGGVMIGAFACVLRYRDAADHGGELGSVHLHGPGHHASFWQRIFRHEKHLAAPGHLHHRGYHRYAVR